MKKILISLIILTFAFLNSCEKQFDLFSENSNDKLSELSPKELALLTMQISKSANNNSQLTRIFKKYDSDLISGSKYYNIAMAEVKKNSESYMEFTGELRALLSREIDFNFKNQDKKENIE